METCWGGRILPKSLNAGIILISEDGPSCGPWVYFPIELEDSGEYSGSNGSASMRVIPDCNSPSSFGIIGTYGCDGDRTDQAEFEVLPDGNLYWSNDFGARVNSACCNLSAGWYVKHGGTVWEGPPVPRSDPPPHFPPCLDVPPDAYDCCMEEQSNPSGGDGGNGGGNSGCSAGSCRPQASSQYPIDYATGAMHLTAADLESRGFGLPWGQKRSFSNNSSSVQNFGLGWNWKVAEWPYIVVYGIGDLVSVVFNANTAYRFNRVDELYVPEFSAVRQTLTYDSETGIYKFSERDGSYYEFQGTRFLRHVSPSGNVIEVTAYEPDGVLFSTIQRTYVEGSNTVVEEYQYAYSNVVKEYAGLVLGSVVLRRKVNGGSWQNVDRVAYTYYGYTAVFGTAGDLQTVTKQEWNGSAWYDTGTSYYRYYTGSSSQFLLKFSLNAAAFERLKNDPSVTDPLTASDILVAQYADFYFEYDNQNRVILERIQGGSQTFSFEYELSANADGYNSWKTKTTETLPDGNQKIVFSNFAGQPMLSVFQSNENATWDSLTADGWSILTADEWAKMSATPLRWISFNSYDDDGYLVLYATPSAVTGFDEMLPDLMGYDPLTGTYAFLRNQEGLINVYTIDPVSGYRDSEGIRQGQIGTIIKIREFSYISHSASSGSVPSWHLSELTEYPSDTDPNRKIITTHDYTFYSGTNQIQQQVTTLPAIPLEQNGTGLSATTKAYFNEYGLNIWKMDERGFISRIVYDIPTGAVIQLIKDVNTSIINDAPVGWVTPPSGGLNLVTDVQSDDRGRPIQILGPLHQVDYNGAPIRRATWMVYDENSAENITRVARGYSTEGLPSPTYTLVNPVTILITDKSNKIREQISATRASSSGRLLPSDTFTQSSFVRWKTTQYSDCCHIASERTYFDIPTSGIGTEGINYDQVNYGYDVMKRRNKVVTGGGTITMQVFDARGMVDSTWIGTNDEGATAKDPSGGEDPGNNMVIITSNVYDDGQDGRNGTLTQQTKYASASDTRVTTFTYDFRDRRITTDGEIDFFQKKYFDNLNREVKFEQYNTTAIGNLIARSEANWNDRNKVYQKIRYDIDPSTGSVGNALVDNFWYDDKMRVIESLPSGSQLFTKTTYDSLGRKLFEYTGFAPETSNSSPSDVSNDVILEQTENTYDNASNIIQTSQRQRYHNAPVTDLGPLGDPGNTPKARVTYLANYPDSLGRTQATVNYGTNGGTALIRPGEIPARSDTALVTSFFYDDAGNRSELIDAAGIITKMDFDDEGREIKKTLNVADTSSSPSSSSGEECSSSDDVNISVLTAYNADGNISSITAENSVTGNQTTQFIYGTTLENSEVASSLLKHQEIYPNSISGSDAITFSYNRQNQKSRLTDQQETVHLYDYDKLGRKTQDRVITLGTGVDGAIRRIASTYEVRGMRHKLTSYDNAMAGAGSIVNECQFAYNGFGQLIADYQAHSGAVNISTTPKVQYGFADGSANTIRPASVTYPNGRVLTYDYGTTAGMDDSASRIATIVDDDLSATHLVDYSYLGFEKTAQSVNSLLANGFVIADYTQPEIKWTLADLSGTNDPDTGDIYSGLDRFGRVKDNRWYGYGALTDVDRIKYGYDRVGNRIWRQNTVAESLSAHFDELYSLDEIQRLKSLNRGTLNGLKDAIGDESFAECWSLDATGNWNEYRQDSDGDGTWDLEQEREANSVNEITDITNSVGAAWAQPAYNAAGNMTTIPRPVDPTQSFTATYDAWNRLVKLVDDSTNATVAEYEYDGAKRRTIETSYTGGTLSETRHLYYTEPSRWQVIEERVGSSTDPDRQNVWGLRYIDDLILREHSDSGTLDQRLYCLQDANWNTTAITDTNGTVQERYAYSAYGTPVFLTPMYAPRTESNFDWILLYAGYRWSEGLQLFGVRNREYNPKIGTWLQPDRIGYIDGPNLYQYVLSNPCTSLDPFGLFALPAGAVGAIGGCLAGGFGGVLPGLIELGIDLLDGTCNWPYHVCNIGCNAAAGCLGGALTGALITTPWANYGTCLGPILSAVSSALCTAIFGCSPLHPCDGFSILLTGAAACLVGFDPDATDPLSAVGDSFKEFMKDLIKEVVDYMTSSLGITSALIGLDVGLGSSVCEGVF